MPDSTYDMIGGLDKQIMEIKEVYLFSEVNSIELMYMFNGERATLSCKSNNNCVLVCRLLNFPSNILNYLNL